MVDPKASAESSYDLQNPFARILRGELPCDRVHESQDALAFQDANPQATAHAVVIAKGQYADLRSFVTHAPPEQVAGLLRAACDTADKLGVAETGWRLVINTGPDAGQEVEHVHLHVLGGEDLGPVLRPEPLDEASVDELEIGPPRRQRGGDHAPSGGKVGVRRSSQQERHAVRE